MAFLASPVLADWNSLKNSGYSLDGGFVLAETGSLYLINIILTE